MRALIDQIVHYTVQIMESKSCVVIVNVTCVVILGVASVACGLNAES